MENAILTEFPNGTSTLKIYDFLPEGKVDSVEKKRYFVPDENGFMFVPFDWDQLEYADEICDNRERLLSYQSYNRTKHMIYNYARCGIWEWFCTFTFSPEKVDRFDYDLLSKKIRVWCNHQKANNPDMKYLIIPEKHKNGAWHFHGLLCNVPNLHFVDSGHKTKGEIIYNLTEWKYGFFTATRVQDAIRCSHYITKYITKDLTDSLDGKQRYFVSNGLKSWKESRFDIPYNSTKDILEIVSDSLGKEIKHIKNSGNSFFNCRYLELQ